jgi:very-short-patch-repair endonuclease
MRFMGGDFLIPPLKGEGGWPKARRVGWSMANARARELRKTMTPQEVKLWVHLRSWRTRGYHVRRQAPRDGRIFDFICLRARLVVEIDGGQHNLDIHADRDRKSDRHFARQDFKVLRFWNNDVDKNLPGVLEVIDRELKNSPTRSASPTNLPRWGRDQKEAS